MKTSSLRLLLTLALATLAADQVTKYLAVSELTTALEGREGVVARLEGFLEERHLRGRATPPHALVQDYWNFRYVENPGAAGGMFGNLPDGVRQTFFHVVSLAALGFILWMYVRLEPAQRRARAALALLAGGALGNFVDRLTRGYVIDFIDWHWRNQPGLRWPTFNVADVAICVGVGLMLLDALRSRTPGVAPLTERPLAE
jgi:signal peptidase II